MASLKKTARILCFALFCAGSLYSQEPSQKEHLRIQFWAELDAFPGLFGDESWNASASESENPGEEASNAAKPADSSKTGQSTLRPELSLFAFAIDRMKQIAPFFLNGMINGWTFDYTPSDKRRRVKEYFEWGELRPFNSQLNPIVYNEPKVIDERLVLWASCNRTEAQKLAFQRWESITHPRLKGVGRAPVGMGFAGIQEASAQAVKNAVHAHWRQIVKNKPKEISGILLLINKPRIYIQEGHYVVDLDFFMETDTMVPYSYY